MASKRWPTAHSMRWGVDHLSAMAALVSMMGGTDASPETLRGALIFLADATMLVNNLTEDGFHEWRDRTTETLAGAQKGLDAYDELLTRKARSRDN